MSSASKKLRACLLCSFLATPSEFKKEGCPNCEAVLELKGDSDRIMECTTPHYDGCIALISPAASWVAKWQRNSKHSPGTYAVRVQGSLPDAVQDQLEERGVVVKSRENDD